MNKEYRISNGEKALQHLEEVSKYIREHASKEELIDIIAFALSHITECSKCPIRKTCDYLITYGCYKAWEYYLSLDYKKGD